jgi:hypothetical protein
MGQKDEMIEMARLRKAGEPEPDEGEAGDDAEGNDGEDAGEDAADREEAGPLSMQGIDRDASSHPTQRRGGCSAASTRWGFVWARRRYGHRIDHDVYTPPMLSAFLGRIRVRFNPQFIPDFFKSI